MQTGELYATHEKMEYITYLVVTAMSLDHQLAWNIYNLSNE